MHYTIEEATQYIVEKLYPTAEVHYDFERVKRQEWIEKYKKRIAENVLSGAVSFYNPHTKKQFPPAWLSEDHFPHDGLLHRDSLAKCLAADHQHFSAQFPRPISKAPAPITPIKGGSSSFAPERGASSAFSEDILTKIQAKELWSEADLQALMCGDKKYFGASTQSASDAELREAYQAILDGISVESLSVASWQQFETSELMAPMISVRYFKPADAIAWVSRARFSKFPFPVPSQLTSPKIMTTTNGAAVQHKLQNRRHALHAVIAQAEKAAVDKSDYQSVWAALVRIAETEPRPAPLLGYVEGEVTYTSDRSENGYAFYTKAALAEHYRRRVKKKDGPR